MPADRLDLRLAFGKLLSVWRPSRGVIGRYIMLSLVYSVVLRNLPCAPFTWFICPTAPDLVEPVINPVQPKMAGNTARLRWTVVAAAAAAAISLAAFSYLRPDNANPASAPARIGHVHGLGVNPADGVLYVAAHNGLFQLAAGGPVRVGDGQQDTMGFTIAGPDVFLASGHPAAGQAGPAHLGLIESSDAGRTWRTLSLAGDADFHVLKVRHGAVYGFNATTGQLMVSRDKTAWQTRASMPIGDLAVSPSNPDTLLATTPAGVQKSNDGGKTWSPAGGPPLASLAWDAGMLWGVTAGGDVLRSADNGSTWIRIGGFGGQATAFAAHGGDLYAALHSRILHSTDQGRTWVIVYSSDAIGRR